jgi:hypothetical protein
MAWTFSSKVKININIPKGEAKSSKCFGDPFFDPRNPIALKH